VNFLHPAFLWALPLAAVPIIIHLLNRRRFQRVDFAAIEFLRRAIKRTRRRLLLEDLLLLLFRTLAVIALILGLARPSTELPELLAQRPARGKVLVLDTSLSMSHRSGGTSAFDRGLSETRSQLAQLDSAMGDRAAIVVAGQHPSRLALGEAPLVASALDGLDQPEFGESQLAVAAAIALQSASTLTADGCQEVSVIFVSDLQASGWDDERQHQRLVESLSAISSAGFSITVVDVGASSAANTAIVELRVEPARLNPGGFGEVIARVRGFNTKAPRSVRLSLIFDGDIIAEHQLEVPANGEISWSHPISPALVGERALEMTIEGDALPADDYRSTVVRVQAAPEVLIVGNDNNPGLARTLLDFIDLGDTAPLQVSNGSAVDLHPSFLDEIDLLVLADPPPLSNEQISAVEAFVKVGGGLLVFLGAESSSANIKRIIDNIGGESLVVGNTATGFARVGISQPDWSPLELFVDPRWQPLLTEVPVLSWQRLELTEPNRMRVPLVLLQENGEEIINRIEPALVEWDYLQGLCVVSNIAPMPGWNRFTEVPGGTLPFLFDLCRHLALGKEPQANLEVGAPLQFLLKRPASELLLHSPDKQQLRPQAAPVALSNGLFSQALVDHARRPGIWRVEYRSFANDGSVIAASELFAVNPPVRESDLRKVTPEHLAMLVPTPDFSVITINSEVAATPPSDNLAAKLFMLVVALLALESLLASLIDRRRG